MVNSGYLSLLLKALSSRRDDFRFLNKIQKLSETLEEWSLWELAELMILIFLTYCWCNSSLISKVAILVFQKFFQVLQVFNIFCLSKGQVIKQYMSNMYFKLKILLHKNSTLNISDSEEALGTRPWSKCSTLYYLVIRFFKILLWYVICYLKPGTSIQI